MSVGTVLGQKAYGFYNMQVCYHRNSKTNLEIYHEVNLIIQSLSDLSLNALSWILALFLSLLLVKLILRDMNHG